MDAQRVMAACQSCRGEGVLRVRNSHADPLFNVAGLALIDGVWTGTCRTCKGDGMIEWTRGVSLPPLIAANYANSLAGELGGYRATAPRPPQ